MISPTSHIDLESPGNRGDFQWHSTRVENFEENLPARSYIGTERARRWPTVFSDKAVRSTHNRIIMCVIGVHHHRQIHQTLVRATETRPVQKIEAADNPAKDGSPDSSEVQMEWYKARLERPCLFDPNFGRTSPGLAFRDTFRSP